MTDKSTSYLVKNFFCSAKISSAVQMLVLIFFVLNCMTMSSKCLSAFIRMSLVVRKQVFRFLYKVNTNQNVQPQRIPRSLNFRL